MKNRKNFTAEFKAGVAIEAARGVTKTPLEPAKA